MARQIVFRGRKITVAQDTDLHANGQTVQRDVVLHPGAVAILPLAEPGRVCLLRNGRPILGQTLWEIPAGTLEPDEPPEQAAVRELIEETGYRAARWRKLGAFYPSPGILSEVTHLYVAEGLTAGEASPEPGEDLRPEVVAWDDAVAWVLDGTIRDLKTVAALLLWDRVRPR